MGGSNDCATFSAKKSVNVIKFYNRSYGVGVEQVVQIQSKKIEDLMIIIFFSSIIY